MVVDLLAVKGEGGVSTQISVIAWDDNHGNYLIAPATIATQAPAMITTTEGDVFTLRRSGAWVLRHRTDSVLSPRIHAFEPCVRHWMPRETTA